MIDEGRDSSPEWSKLLTQMVDPTMNSLIVAALQRAKIPHERLMKSGNQITDLEQAPAKL